MRLDDGSTSHYVDGRRGEPVATVVVMMRRNYTRARQRIEERERLCVDVEAIDLGARESSREESRNNPERWTNKTKRGERNKNRRCVMTSVLLL